MTERELLGRIARRARRAELRISPELINGLEAYFRLLARWNEKINLTALPLAEAPDESIDRLLIEPLIAAKHVVVPDFSKPRIIDLGSGGGSPAIPLKLALPGSGLLMVEAKTRKSAFLREAIRTLGLKDAAVETARYEELLTRPDLHEAADVLTLRAVRVEMRTLMTVQAFVRPGGELFLFRGPGGVDFQTALTPPLVCKGTHPLVESLRSRLVILTKNAVPASRL